VVVVGDNRPRLYASMLAVQALGGVPIPLYQDAASLEFVFPINNAEVRFAVVENQEQVDKLLEIRAQCPQLACIWYDDPRGLRKYDEPGLASLDALMEAGAARAQRDAGFFDAEVARCQPQDVAAMFFTSGTTGNPKGVVHTHFSLLDRAAAGQAFDKLTYLFVLWAPTGAIAEFQLVDPMGGVADLAADTEATYQAAIAAAVAAPAATTATVAGGIASWLVIDPRGRGTGELDLVVIVRNVGARPRRWTYRSWPRAAQSRCALELVDAAGLQVPARPVPIAARDIRAYFAKHGPRYDLTLAPGDTAMLGLDRVTTAAPGWGYKERLGFVYYPPPAPGRYTIAARCTNLVGARGFGTAALAVTL
jgi:hypothetical protein